MWDFSSAEIHTLQDLSSTSRIAMQVPTFLAKRVERAVRERLDLWPILRESKADTNIFRFVDAAKIGWFCDVPCLEFQGRHWIYHDFWELSSDGADSLSSLVFDAADDWTTDLGAIDSVQVSKLRWSLDDSRVYGRSVRFATFVLVDQVLRIGSRRQDCCDQYGHSIRASQDIMRWHLSGRRRTREKVHSLLARLLRAAKCVRKELTQSVVGQPAHTAEYSMALSEAVSDFFCKFGQYSVTGSFDVSDDVDEMPAPLRASFSAACRFLGLPADFLWSLMLHYEYPQKQGLRCFADYHMSPVIDSLCPYEYGWESWMCLGDDKNLEFVNAAASSAEEFQNFRRAQKLSVRESILESPKTRSALPIYKRKVRPQLQEP